MKLNIVILAGGEGKRLWPLVHEDMPKPLLKLRNDKTLLEETVDRFSSLGNIFVVMTKKQIEMTKKILPKGSVEYIEETSPSGTSVAMRLAAEQFLGKELLLFTPADQLINQVENLHYSITLGKNLASKGQIVLFGTKPTFPDIHLGYFRTSSNNSVDEFIEKPDKESAIELINEPNVFWHMGITLMRADTLISAWENHFDPNMRSFEHSILMRAPNVSAFSVDSTFKDLGNFESIEPYLKKSENVKTLDVNHSIIYSDDLPIKAIGLDEMVVIATKNGILVTKRDSSQKLQSL